MVVKRYKRAVVAGFVHSIYRACSTWQLFHESHDRAKTILIKNQYPAPFFEKIIHDTLTCIFKPEERHEKEVGENKPHMIFLQYGGKCSEAYAIHNLCQILCLFWEKKKKCFPKCDNGASHTCRVGTLRISW